MTSAQKKKKKRELKRRAIMSAIMLAGCLALVILAAFDLAKNGISGNAIIYAIGFIALFFITGYIAQPVMAELQKRAKPDL